MIGSGIFTVIGTAIAGQKFETDSILNAPVLEYLIHHSASFGRPGAGPAIALSFILVAIACTFTALCYAELASMIPIAGSAYTYTYATMGELIAWIIGWDLILEYAVSNMAVSVGFAAHLIGLGCIRLCDGFRRPICRLGCRTWPETTCTTPAGILVLIYRHSSW